jgi:hypothetical protein
METVIFVRNVFNNVSDHKVSQPRKHYELHRHENLKSQYNLNIYDYIVSVLNECVQGIGAIILREKRTVLFGENDVPAQLIWDGQALNLGLKSERLANNRLSHGSA